MKKLLFLLAGIAILGINATAQQVDTRSKLQFGIKAGGNFSNVYDSEGEDFNADPKVGLAIGSFFSIPVGEVLGIQPEVLFSQKGFKATGTMLGSSYSFTRTTNYIDIPIYFTLKPISFLTIMAGPQYSYLLQQKDVFTNQSNSLVLETEFDNDNIRKNTICFTGGFDLNFNHLALGARVGWDLFKNNGDGTSTTPRYKNVWYQLTLGYKIYN